MGDLKGYFGELGEEMEAIANYLDIDLGVIVTLNLSYELRRVWYYINSVNRFSVDIILYCNCSVNYPTF